MTTIENIDQVENSSALNFIAEGVNIYNWHLRNENNPNCLMFDQTNHAKRELYINLMSSSVNNEDRIFNLLNLTLYKLSIILHRDDNDFHTLAILFSNFIHNRQKILHETGEFPQAECFLFMEIEDAMPHEVTPKLYISIYELEKKYINIILNSTIETRKTLYNYYRINNYPCQSFGDAFVAIEVLYMNDAIETILNASNINIRLMANSTKIETLECPICYEVQISSNRCITTNCNHTYCEYCFRRILESGAQPITCPMCRCRITEGVESEII
jgi:hypothetical protein